MEIKIITLGTFDMPHTGHMNLFKRCRDIAGPDGQVAVGLNTDEFVEKYKGEPPIMSYDERKAMLLTIPYIDLVVPNRQVDGSVQRPIMDTQSNLIVIGSDWGRKDYLKQIGLTWEWIEESDLSLMYVPYSYGISTTILKERLRKQLSSPLPPIELIK